MNYLISWEIVAGFDSLTARKFPHDWKKTLMSYEARWTAGLLCWSVKSDGCSADRGVTPPDDSRIQVVADEKNTTISPIYFRPWGMVYYTYFEIFGSLLVYCFDN